jgi:predicted transcriptional regulator
MTKDIPKADLLNMTAQIVSSYVSHNTVSSNQLSGLIESVSRAIATVGQEPEQPPEAEKQKPAVPIKRSVQSDHLVCLECGEKLTMLKRHLRTNHGMTPEDYREKWGLSTDYPMVAPAYAQQRSELAKTIGLGSKTRRGRSAA